MLRAALCSAVLVTAADATGLPEIAKEYEAVIMLKMPYIPMEMPFRVLTSGTVQKVEYYDGLQADWSNKDGDFKYLFNNSHRQCVWSPPPSGPTSFVESEATAKPPAWKPLPFFPDLSRYTRVADELVGGVMCEKYTLDVKHGETGTMNDHLAFFWDPVLSKPVRWHMHSRHVTFGSHTDEYIMDFLSFETGAPSDKALEMPKECVKPASTGKPIQLRQFLASIHKFGAFTEVREAASPMLYEAYLNQHGKAYSADEFEFRRSVFEGNLRMIKELNERHAGKTTFKGNRFLDMTRMEVLSFKGGKSGKGATREERRAVEDLKFVSAFETEGKVLPKDFDWRVAKPGVVSPVKDQAMCGSCWTYGFTEPLEAIQAIKTGNNLVELPEQFVLDCTWTEPSAKSQNAGCDGGNSDEGAFEIIRKYGGVVPTAAAYGSYLSVNGYCKDTKLMDVGAKITGWVDVTARDEKALMEALVKHGPMSVSIQVPDEMLYYDSGVFRNEACRQSPAEIDHSVSLTGFGTDENGVDYWVVRNSWSTYWGDQGYIKIARGDLDCCVSCEAGFPKVDAAEETLVV